MGTRADLFEQLNESEVWAPNQNMEPWCWTLHHLEWTQEHREEKQTLKATGNVLVWTLTLPPSSNDPTVRNQFLEQNHVGMTTVGPWDVYAWDTNKGSNYKINVWTDLNKNWHNISYVILTLVNVQHMSVLVRGKGRSLKLNSVKLCQILMKRQLIYRDAYLEHGLYLNIYFCTSCSIWNKVCVWMGKNQR